MALAVYRLMADGTPADPRHVAALTGMSEAMVASLIESLPTCTVEGGAVAAFLGLQLWPGRHGLSFGDTRLGTWCAWDTIFLPPLIGRPGRADSCCPVTGMPVVVEVDERGRITSATPPDVVLSFLAHPSPFTAELGVGFCRWINFFSGPKEALTWSEEAAKASAVPLLVLSLEDAVALSRRTNALIFGRAG